MTVDARVAAALDSIPPPSDRRLAVRVTRDALRHVRAGHPWIFDESVTSISDAAPAGDLAVVFDADRRFAAIGLYDPGSPIAIRVLHQGRPRTIDAGWLDERIWAADALRATLHAGRDGARAGYRIVNGENDGLPGLVVDRYAAVAVVKLYSAAWLPWLRAVVAGVVAIRECSGVVLRLARNVQSSETFGLEDGDVIAGDVPAGPVLFEEGGLTFEADVRAGQKTGHFLDQRANRLRVGAMSDGADVLDVFASTGGFSVHAAAGGARRVVSVDLSAPTLSVAERNMAHNADVAAVAACDHATIVGDAFEVMADLRRRRERFDLVVVDPPSFAPRRDAIPRALRAYTRLTHLALPLIRSGGTLVQASCSAHVTADVFASTVRAAADAAGRRLEQLAFTGHDVDHPVGFPEGAYLKAGFWRATGGR